MRRSSFVTILEEEMDAKKRNGGYPPLLSEISPFSMLNEINEMQTILDKANLEVDRLNRELSYLEGMPPELAPKWKKRAEVAEAEVERLTDK